MQPRRFPVCLALCVVLLSAPAHSQVLSGVISGTVTDSSKAVVPNAAITIVNSETGVTAWRGVTNESGVYRAPGLPVGRYNVSVEREGSSGNLSPASTSPLISAPELT